jgi:hypothetical protein
LIILIILGEEYKLQIRTISFNIQLSVLNGHVAGYSTDSNETNCRT